MCSLLLVHIAPPLARLHLLSSSSLTKQHQARPPECISRLPPLSPKLQPRLPDFPSTPCQPCAEGFQPLVPAFLPILPLQVNATPATCPLTFSTRVLLPVYTSYSN
uniref:Bovid-specific transcript Y linked 2 n=1 Tax=Bos taurus TaxID=9913 RepID=S5G959_BOVIN|nr:bovid-specific transcript Y linked 2 [Bos taurus]